MSTIPKPNLGFLWLETMVPQFFEPELKPLDSKWFGN